MTDFERDQEEQIIDGQILSDDDQTMLNLPPVPFEDEYIDDFDVGAYSEDQYDDYDYDYYEAAADEDEPVSDPGRRHFLTRVLLGGVAATALGGSAALLYDQYAESAPSVAALTMERGPLALPWHEGQSPVVVFAIGALGGLVMAAVVAVVTGLGLRALLSEATP